MRPSRKSVRLPGKEPATAPKSSTDDEGASQGSVAERATLELTTASATEIRLP